MQAETDRRTDMKFIIAIIANFLLIAALVAAICGFDGQAGILWAGAIFAYIGVVRDGTHKQQSERRRR